MELNPNIPNRISKLLIRSCSGRSLSSVCSAALAHIARRRPAGFASEQAIPVYAMQHDAFVH
jgi:hypothetical protein